MGFLDKMRELVSPANDASAAAGGELEVSFRDPGPDAITCPIRFDRPVSPGGTSLYETPEEAAAWPAVRALLGIPGVHSVIAKGEVLVLARHDSVPWSEVLTRVQPALEAAFGSVSAPLQLTSPQSAPSTKRAAASRRPSTPEEDALRERVQAVIDDVVNPAVADHGGVITLLDVRDTRVFVHMGGGCQGCAMSTATLKQGVETMLRSRVPEVSEVLDTTDHAAGTNPYFRS